MKTLTALCLASALLMTAGLAQAKDVSPAQIVELSTSGAILPFAKLDAAALAEHPNARILETDLKESYGRYIYQVDLRDDKKQSWEIELDATSAEVLTNQQDD